MDFKFYYIFEDTRVFESISNSQGGVGWVGVCGVCGWGWGVCVGVCVCVCVLLFRTLKGSQLCAFFP